MKIALYDPYLDTMGGGERYICTIAEELSKKNEVSILWNDQSIINKIGERLHLDLSKVKIVSDPFINKTSLYKKYMLQKQFDRLFFLSDGSFPFGLSKKNYLHFQFPVHWTNGKSMLNQLKLKTYKSVICNSQFTKKIIDQTYGINSIVIYPPVDVDQFIPLNKEKLIISVARFSKSLHSKKQEILIEAFKKLYEEGITDWKLVLTGGMDSNSKDIVEILKQQAERYPINIIPNIKFNELKSLYGKASIYWHGTGFNIDLEKEPEKAEHFGITVVEAMSAGCIPIVVNNGGPKEIIEPGISGEVYETIEELINKTRKIMNSENKRKEMSQNAIKRSKQFSKEKFCGEIKEVISVNL
jgi:glycosyltransferase involved in cell wall biosynthesis